MSDALALPETLCPPVRLGHGWDAQRLIGGGVRLRHWRQLDEGGAVVDTDLELSPEKFIELVTGMCSPAWGPDPRNVAIVNSLVLRIHFGPNHIGPDLDHEPEPKEPSP